MKHHVNIIFLGLFLNLCYGTPTGSTTPTFSLSEERSLDGSPKINIVFANGKSDTMILTKFDSDEEEEPPIEDKIEEEPPIEDKIEEEPPIEDKIETEAEVEECMYLGHLENEPSACIAMAGCPGVEKVEFTIFSKNVFDSPAYVWTKEGSVEMIEMENSYWDYVRDDNDTYVPPVEDNYVPIEEDRKVYKPNRGYIGDKYCDDGNNNPEYNFDGGDCCVDKYIKDGKKGDYCSECRCKTMKLDLKIGFGKSFYQNMKSKGEYWTGAINFLQKAMLLAQPYFCHESLGHRIKLSYSKWAHNYKFYKDHTFRVDSKYKKIDANKHKDGIWNFNEVLDLVEKDLGGADLMVLLGYDENDFWSNGNFKGGSTGYAFNEIVCTEGIINNQDAKRFKWSINEWSSKGPGATASTIAHEIGHNIGMKHDHDHDQNGPCNCQGNMSYKKYCKTKWQNEKRPIKWSTCSKNDFVKHYHREKNNWCMASTTTNFCP